MIHARLNHVIHKEIRRHLSMCKMHFSLICKKNGMRRQSPFRFIFFKEKLTQGEEGTRGEKTGKNHFAWK